MPQNKGPHLEFFSEARLALMKEVKENWPAVDEELAVNNYTEWPDQIGTIAAFCNVALDGMYTPGELDILADQLIYKLQGLRKGIKTAPIGQPINTKQVN